MLVPDSDCQQGKNEVPSQPAVIQCAQSVCVNSQPLPLPVPSSHSLGSSCLPGGERDTISEPLVLLAAHLLEAHCVCGSASDLGR